MTSGIPAGVGREELKRFEELARRFAGRSLSAIFQGDFPDGDLSRLGEVIETAFDIGIAGSPDPSLPGSDFGVWGGAIGETGLLPSIVLLSAVAESCGGVAMAIAAQGVASNILSHAGFRAEPMPKRAAALLLLLVAYFGLRPLVAPPPVVVTPNPQGNFVFLISDDVNAIGDFTSVDVSISRVALA